VDYLTDEQRSYRNKEPVELGADLQFGPLGAEKIIGAEKEGKKIAVEVKTFMEDSPVSAFHKAINTTIIA
jgi:hypothetical protein